MGLLRFSEPSRVILGNSAFLRICASYPDDQIGEHTTVNGILSQSFAFSILVACVFFSSLAA